MGLGVAERAEIVDEVRRHGRKTPNPLSEQAAVCVEPRWRRAVSVLAFQLGDSEFESLEKGRP